MQLRRHLYVIFHVLYVTGHVLTALGRGRLGHLYVNIHVLCVEDLRTDDTRCRDLEGLSDDATWQGHPSPPWGPG